MEKLGLSSPGSFIYLPESVEEMTMPRNSVNVTQPPSMSESLHSDDLEQSLLQNSFFADASLMPPFTDVSSRPSFPEADFNLDFDSDYFVQGTSDDQTYRMQF
jgi:hypothetical protein